MNQISSFYIRNIPNHFLNYTIAVILGQACGLHNRVSMSGPEQLNPLCCGRGLSQARVLYCVPFSQDRVHCVQFVHFDQLPFTEKTNKQTKKTISKHIYFIEHNIRSSRFRSIQQRSKLTFSVFQQTVVNCIFPTLCGRN